MKKLILTIGFLFSMQAVFSQSESIGDWIFSVTSGIEAHDKRLFNGSESEMLLEMQPEFFGTYHVGLSVHRKFLERNKLKSFIGVGASYENATFIRPFNHFYFPGDSVKILYFLNNYKKYSTNLSLFISYDFGSDWILSGEARSNFLIYRELSNSAVKFSETTFELDYIEIRLGVNRRIGNFLIGVNSRVFNYQKIDKIIFNELIKDPRVDEKWERYNPLRFDLTVGYMW